MPYGIRNRVAWPGRWVHAILNRLEWMKDFHHTEKLKFCVVENTVRRECAWGFWRQRLIAHIEDLSIPSTLLRNIRHSESNQKSEMFSLNKYEHFPNESQLMRFSDLVRNPHVRNKFSSGITPELSLEVFHKIIKFTGNMPTDIFHFNLFFPINKKDQFFSMSKKNFFFKISFKNAFFPINKKDQFFSISKKRFLFQNK